MTIWCKYIRRLHIVEYNWAPNWKPHDVATNTISNLDYRKAISLYCQWKYVTCHAQFSLVISFIRAHIYININMRGHWAMEPFNENVPPHHTDQIYTVSGWVASYIACLEIICYSYCRSIWVPIKFIPWYSNYSKCYLLNFQYHYSPDSQYSKNKCVRSCTW